MNISVRFYESCDYKELIILLNQVYNSVIDKKDLEEKYLSDCKYILVATDSENHIIGCTFIEIQEDFIRPNKISFVTYVAVDERYRHHGVGTKLLKYVELISHNKGCTAIELTSANYRTGAHAFYESIGYTKKKTTVFIKEIVENN